MSHTQAVHEAMNISDAGMGNHQHPSQPAPTHAPQGVSNFVDGSGHIFSMYLEMASEEDKKMAENWKADADGILIFTGLFSAAVASLISVSIQDLRQNPQDTSNFYLANIYRTLADPNGSNISSSLPTSPPPFSPTSYAIWVNSLWFLSLVISLTCALLATFLQQWARRYLKVTQSRYSLHKRARIRAFFAEGVEQCLLPWAVETLPMLLHISLFLFFSGLVVFLWNVNLTIFKLVLSWIGICTALYGCITLMPILRRDSPYYTSLSSLVWFVVTGIAYIAYELRWWFQFSVRDRRPVFWRFRGHSHERLLWGMQRTAEATALNSRSEIDTRTFMWTFDCLDEDHELERFFSGLPGFRSSNVVDDPLPRLTEDQKWKLSYALTGLLSRTFSSDLLPAPVKERRAMLCAKATDPIHIPMTFDVLDLILSDNRDNEPLTTEILQIVRGWGSDRDDEDTTLVVQATVCSIVTRARRRNDAWFILASKELGVPELVLREYATHGDSLSLAILIHITRQQFNHFYKVSWPWYRFSKVLESASKFDVRDTSSELQHNFCALWNQIVLKVQNENSWVIAANVLQHIRNIYITLHQDSVSCPTQFSASPGDEDEFLRELPSYPVCNVADHFHDHSPSASFTQTVLHDNAALPAAFFANPHPPSSSAVVPLHDGESLADAPPLDDFYPAHQITDEDLRVPATLLNPTTSGARDHLSSGITRPTPEPEASTSPHPLLPPQSLHPSKAQSL